LKETPKNIVEEIDDLIKNIKSYSDLRSKVQQLSGSTQIGIETVIKAVYPHIRVESIKKAKERVTKKLKDSANECDNSLKESYNYKTLVAFKRAILEKIFDAEYIPPNPIISRDVKKLFKDHGQYWDESLQKLKFLSEKK